MGILAEIRDNNVIQPNRTFTFAGDVRYIERETEYTKLILAVFSYYNIGEPLEEWIIYFKDDAKKVADKVIQPKLYVRISGDIIKKNDIIFFNGKIIEVFKQGQYLTENNSKTIDVKDIGHNRAY